MSAQVLVTGGTGFIGRHVVRRLLERGDRVRLLTRRSNKARELFGDRAEVVEGDLRNASSVRQACRDAERIYHIGGVYSFGPYQRAELREVNTRGTETLLRAAWEGRVERVLHVSTAGVLVNHGGIITEEHFPERPPFGCHYKSSKWHAEKRALEWARRGLPVVIANPTCPIGAGDERPTPTGAMIRDFLRGKFPFYSRTGLNFINVEDLAGGLLAAADKGCAGHRYIFGQDNLWLGEFLTLLAATAKLPQPRVCLPLSFVAVMGAAGECADLVSRRTNGRLCVETAFQARRRQFFDSSKAREELGWQPSARLDAAVQEAVEWFRQKMHA